MARTGENIFKRKDGRWEARYMKERDASGRIKYGFCYGKTYTEAKAKVELRKAEIRDKNSSVNADDRNFSFYCREWLKIRGSTVNESTCLRYKLLITKHIEPALGEYPAEEIDTEKVRRFTEKLIENRLSPMSVRNILTVLRSVLDYTAKRCPTAIRRVEISFPKKAMREKRTFSYAEQEKLTEYLLRDIDESKFGVLLALYTGIRLGELCALRWYNISLEEKTVEIEATMQRIGNTDPKTNGGKKTKILISPPGNDSARRVIPLTDRALALCMQLKPRDERVYVLTGMRNFYPDPHTVQIHFKRYAHDCGLGDVYFGMLRNTFAARCAEVGFEIKLLSEIMGYSTANIPLGRYISTSMELKRSNMEKLSEIGM